MSFQRHLCTLNVQPKRESAPIVIEVGSIIRYAVCGHCFLFPKGARMTLSLAVLMTALLFGGMALYSFGFAAFLFAALPTPVAGATLRRAFPWFYLFVMGTSGLAALLWWPHDAAAAAVTAAVALTTYPVRQLLMPAINRATDADDRQLFRRLHGVSVAVTLAHIAATGWLLARIV